MTFRVKLGLSSSVFALLLCGQSLAASYSGFSVTGNGRIEDSVVLGIAGLTPGAQYNDGDINAAVQRLYASGLFSEVEIIPSGSTLVINVQENATIGRVFFEGNTNVDDEQLATLVNVGSRAGLDRNKIEEDAQNIKRFYAAQSRFDAKVTPVIIPVTDGVFNVVYEIDEGTVSSVERVTFTGNQSVSDAQLRRSIESGETNLLSPIFTKDNYANEKLLSDQQKIQNYYEENGFYRAQIRAVNANYDALGNFYLNYTINEGQRFRINNVNFTSEVPGVDAGQFSADNKLRQGQIYKASNIRKTIEDIEASAARAGSPFLRVEPIITANEVNGTLDVTFRYYNGARNYVDRIDIHGNEGTVDRVIRRQFDVVEGDPINERKISEAQRKLERTGLFSRVAVNLRETSTVGKQIIDVEVEEAQTGSLGFGGGYSDGDGWGIFGEFSERNFLGKGQRVSARLDITQRSQDVRFDFTEPGFFERDLAAGFSAYYGNRDRSASNFQTTDIGFEPRLSFPLTENSRLSLGYFIRSNEIRDVTDNASPLVKADEGTVVTSGLSATWSIDQTNRAVDPSRGYILRLGGELAGLGGDANWYRLNGRGKIFYPILSDDVIFSASIEGGLIESLNDDPVKITERAFYGGDSFFGFRPGGIGPRDYTGEVNTSLGGKYYASFLAELRFPLGLPEELGLTGGAYYQAGSVWGLDVTEGGAMGEIDDASYIRQSVGASLIWNLGGQNLRFTWSNPFDAQDYDLTDQFQISLATKF